MKRRTIKEMIEAKERVERGESAPAKVWEFRTNENGRLVRRPLSARAFQRAQKKAWEKSIAATREKLGLSQGKFAQLLGISVRTLHHWEQGRRTPSGAAKVLLRVAALHPEALLDAA